MILLSSCFPSNVESTFLPLFFSITYNDIAMSHQDEEEEEDYMSEAFLNSLVAEESTKSKSKVNMSYSERRRQKEREHLANLPKPLHVREKEAREQGLEKEIGEDNKGMAMLLKMGFK